MTDRLQGIKPGDRVRVTFDARVMKTYANDGVMLAIEGVDPTTTCLPYSPSEVASPTFQIERIEPPLKVGDRVRHKGEVGVIVAMSRGFAWVEWSITPSPMTILLSDLERIA